MPLPRIYLSSPHMGGGELALVQEAFATNWIAPLGPQVDAFEREFVELLSEVRSPQSSVLRPPSPAPLHAAALSSGTAALHLALRLIGVKAGDEIFCSTLTFSASANPHCLRTGTTRVHRQRTHELEHGTQRF